MRIILDGDRTKKLEIENIDGAVHVEIHEGDGADSESMTIKLPMGEFEKGIAAYNAAEKAEF